MSSSQSSSAPSSPLVSSIASKRLVNATSSSKSAAATTAKRSILPRTQLIKFFIDESSTTTSTTTAGELVGASGGGCGGSGGQKRKVLPDLTAHHDVIKKLNFQPKLGTACEQLPNIAKQILFTQQNTTTNTTNQPASTSNKIKQQQTLLKKCEKDKKFKETLFYLNHFIVDASASSASAAAASASPQINDDDAAAAARNLIKHLAKEFLVDCRQRLSNESFVKLLVNLNDFKASNRSDDQRLIDDIHALIKHDPRLLNKFAGFLTCERAVHYDLFMQASQYEKCYDFFHKLEFLLPTKSAFKKLVQSIIATSSFETDTVQTKLDEIKAKLRSVCKNNAAFINVELDYLFDQRWPNLEPSFEAISLVAKSDSTSATTSTTTMDASLADKYRDHECISLSAECPIDFGTKKCSCSCHHPSSSTTTTTSASSSSSSSDNNNNNSHCLICSLKFVKEKLCIKCEGKKAVPLIYRIYQHQQHQNSTTTATNASMCVSSN